MHLLYFGNLLLLTMKLLPLSQGHSTFSLCRPLARYITKWGSNDIALLGMEKRQWGEGGDGG